MKGAEIALKTKTSSVLIVLSSALLSILFVGVLVFSIPYFTIYSTDNFKEGVFKNIDENKLEENIKALLSTNIETYAHNADIVTSVLDKHELKQTAAEYFNNYYDAFINGEDVPPKIKYRNNNFYLLFFVFLLIVFLLGLDTMFLQHLLPILLRHIYVIY